MNCEDGSGVSTLPARSVARAVIRVVPSAATTNGDVYGWNAPSHGTTKRQVVAMFDEERTALGPLPLEPFRYYRFGVRTVHLDGCLEVDAAYYERAVG